MSAWRDRPERWGRLVETAVGAHLVTGPARAFRARYPHSRTLPVGADGVGLAEFLLTQAAEWL